MPNIGELGKLEYIGGNLSIENLQNVKSPADALDARLKDKKHLEDLTLDYLDNTSSNISKSDQITVLKSLKPHTNLKSLRINKYGGKSFPDWITHHSFSKIESIYLYDCKYCHILPSFGQLHALESLYIIGFHGIASVGKEFYGSYSSTFKPFEALKVLRFEDMPDWENWLCFDSENEGEAFPHLAELYIVNCPKLTGGLPIHLPSLARLKIVECSQLEASLPRSPTLCQLKLTNFNEVLLNELPSRLLQKVVLEGCAVLRSLSEGMMDSSSPLQELEIYGCSSLMLLFEDGLSSTLETLKISNCAPANLIAEINIITVKGCENLESLTYSEQHETDSAASTIRIQKCPNFVSFSDEGLRAQNLKTFEINGCGSLRSLPDKMHLLLPSLESLFISMCPMLQSFGEGGLSTNLKSISILDCDKLVASRTTWGLQKLLSLQEFYIHGKCKDVESFPEPALLPMTITSLTISGFSNMTSLDNLGLQHFTSLKTMRIYDCPNLKFLPKDGFHASISSLGELQDRHKREASWEQFRASFHGGCGNVDARRGWKGI
ncbi:hypothetical protein F2P56_011223 [Juglans regia]|uniref:R13L1/DRL21-like LRR repeat region domain-containing protein n=1 Tax=Juglans regia TaxID=51240 RepID=A0A833XLZ2_JUGRE|nr:hypothetical protein F2P56_011223 [Juglans regia]